MTDLLAIILAAGDGTRMRSDIPKVLHEVGGLPIVSHVARAAAGAGATRLAVVTAPGHDDVRAKVRAVAPSAEFFEQVERKGTGHAAAMARAAWETAQGYVIVVYADHPLLRSANFKGITDRLDAGWDAAILGFEPRDPTGYGRLLTNGEQLLAIREHKDATEEERKIVLSNACILGFRAEVFRELIDQLRTNNAQGEYYLTDLVELANKAGRKVTYHVAPERDVMGVNDRKQLAKAETQFQELRRDDFMAAGVTMKDPSTVYFSYDTEIGRDVILEPSVYFGPGVKIGNGVTIHAFSHIEGATVGDNAEIGPFARLRPEAVLAESVKVGNFVEVKKANIGKGSKINHLSYVGDTQMGAKVNVGAGVITCNYDGVNKSQTTIGDNVFVGSNSSLVAPVTVGDGAYVGSGSVITKDVEPEALAIGRARQENKADYAPRLRARAEALKAARKKG